MTKRPQQKSRRLNCDQVRLTEQKMGQKGSALIEASVSGILVMIVLPLFFALLYLAFVRLWSNYWLYQGTLCAAAKAPVAVCQQQTRHKIKQFLPYGRVLELRINTNSWQVSADYKIAVMTWVLTKRRQLRL